jgi:hypothetical protein
LKKKTVIISSTYTLSEIPITMRKHLKTISMLALWASLFSGCYYIKTKKIQTNTLILPRDTRILTCEAKRDFLTYEINKFKSEIQIPGIVFVSYHHTATKGVNLNRLVRQIIKDTQVHMALVINPIDKLEQQYDPYWVFRGWEKRTYINGFEDGRPIYRTKSVPVYETRYKHECTRTTYRLFQYNADGQMMGALHIKNPAFSGCPETSDKDVHYDEIEYLITWLKSNIIVK